MFRGDQEENKRNGGWALVKEPHIWSGKEKIQVWLGTVGGLYSSARVSCSGKREKCVLESWAII